MTHQTSNTDTQYLTKKESENKVLKTRLSPVSEKYPTKSPRIKGRVYENYYDG